MFGSPEKISSNSSKFEMDNSSNENGLVDVKVKLFRPHSLISDPLPFKIKQERVAPVEE